MHQVASVDKLRRIAFQRVDYLRSVVVPFTVRDHPADRAVSFAAIELLNCWNGFSRAYYLSTCARWKWADGTKVTTTTRLSTTEDALTHAVHTCNKGLRKSSGPWSHAQEPVWFDSGVLLKLMTSVGASNTTALSSALSVPNRVLKDLTTVRNFLAHRAENTAVKAKRIGANYAAPPGSDPVEICLLNAPGRPQSVIADWCSELRLIFDIATS
ncbi:MAG: hypothetical protein QOH69_1253 [Actinomycetota bacterium]|jgi:hypothetical protein|nr:hypothetical protein [Actinomycetota bacterium]